MQGSANCHDECEAVSVVANTSGKPKSQALGLGEESSIPTFDCDVSLVVIHLLWLSFSLFFFPLVFPK